MIKSERRDTVRELDKILHVKPNDLYKMRQLFLRYHQSVLQHSSEKDEKILIDNVDCVEIICELEGVGEGDVWMRSLPLTFFVVIEIWKITKAFRHKNIMTSFSLKYYGMAKYLIIYSMLEATVSNFHEWLLKGLFSDCGMYKGQSCMGQILIREGLNLNELSA
ncbi:hypothetical protein ACJX0J_028577 [Zea mays]